MPLATTRDLAPQAHTANRKRGGQRGHIARARSHGRARAANAYAAAAWRPARSGRGGPRRLARRRGGMPTPCLSMSGDTWKLQARGRGGGQGGLPHRLHFLPEGTLTRFGFVARLEGWLGALGGAPAARVRAMRRVRTLQNGCGGTVACQPTRMHVFWTSFL